MGLSEEKGVPCKWFEPLIMTKTIIQTCKVCLDLIWFDFEILDWLGNGFKVENMVIEDSLIFFGVFKQTYVEV